MFSAGQALLAAKAGATYVSPFIGRLDDISTDGVQLIEQIRMIYDNYGFGTEILAASIRHPMHIVQCAEVGADVATCPLSAIMALFDHPLTTSRPGEVPGGPQEGGPSTEGLIEEDVARRFTPRIPNPGRSRLIVDKLNAAGW